MVLSSYSSPGRRWRCRRSSEGSTLGRLDPGGVGVRELSLRFNTGHITCEGIKTDLEGHDTAVPTLCLGLVHARAERERVDEAVRGIAGSARLADDELVEVDAVVGDLEQRGSREGATCGVEEALAIGVQALCKCDQSAKCISRSGRKYSRL